MPAVAVTTVDFLPADFRAERRRRRVRRGRGLIATAFLLLLLLGLAGNHVQRARLRADLDRLRPQAANVADLRKSLGQLTQKIQQLDVQADVRSRLRFRPAPTRLLASVTSAMPDRLTLQELEIREERPVATYTAPTRKGRDDKTEKPPEQVDLERLLADQTRQILTLRGFAPDDATVSQYLVNLRETRTFDDVTLLFTDRHDRDGAEVRAFSVQVRVRSPLSGVVAGVATAGGAL